MIKLKWVGWHVHVARMGRRNMCVENQGVDFILIWKWILKVSEISELDDLQIWRKN